MIEEARWWSWRRQRLDRTARGIEDALHSVLAITSANPNAPLALLARVPRMLQGMYEGATHARIAVRLPAMRKAVWMLAADTAHVPFNACRVAAGFERALLRRAGVGPDAWAELHDRILEVCSEPREARDVKAAAGGQPDRVNAVMNVMALTGELLRTKAPSLHSNAFAFVSTSSWLGQSLPSMPAEEALELLAADYLQAYGPVTVEDFSWWTGIPSARCEAALMIHQPVTLDDGYLLWAAHARAFEQSRPVANRVNLLPALDPYPMGYADRSRLGAPAALRAVTDAAGGTEPIVLVEGHVAGRWDVHATKSNLVTITVEMFETPPRRLWDAIEAECGAIGTLFQARTLRVERDKVRLGRTAPAVGRAASAGVADKKPAPARKAPGRKSAARKAVGGKSLVRKAVARKAAVRKAAGRKSAGRKAAAAGRKAAGERTPARRPRRAETRRRGGKGSTRKRA